MENIWKTAWTVLWEVGGLMAENIYIVFGQKGRTLLVWEEVESCWEDENVELVAREDQVIGNSLHGQSLLAIGCAESKTHSLFFFNEFEVTILT